MKIIRMKRMMISGEWRGNRGRRSRRREERKSEPKSGHPADMRYPYN